MFPERLASGGSRSLRVSMALLTIQLFLAVCPGKTTTPGTAAEKSEKTNSAYDARSFINALARLETALEDARNSPEAIRKLRESLADSWKVETGGQQFNVSTGLLASRLIKAEKQPEFRRQQIDQSREYLEALAGEVAAISGQPPDEDAAKAKLDAILARPEFTSSSHRTWWDRLHDRVNELIFDLLRKILARVGGQKEIGQMLLWVGLCGASVLIAYWIFNHWLRSARLEEMAFESARVQKRSWQQWIFASRSAADRQDYRLATQCAYWAAITRLQELGSIADDRAKTPREYLRSLSTSDSMVPESHASRLRALSILTSRLEAKWYGYGAATEADFRDSLAQLEVLGCHLP